MSLSRLSWKTSLFAPPLTPAASRLLYLLPCVVASARKPGFFNGEQIDRLVGKVRGIKSFAQACEMQCSDNLPFFEAGMLAPDKMAPPECTNTLVNTSTLQCLHLKWVGAKARHGIAIATMEVEEKWTKRQPLVLKPWIPCRSSWRRTLHWTS